MKSLTMGSTLLACVIASVGSASAEIVVRPVEQKNVTVIVPSTEGDVVSVDPAPTSAKPLPTAQARSWRDDASRGDTKAMLRLASGHLNRTDGLPLDPAEACMWFERAAVAGEPLALLGQAYCLASGTGSPRSPGRARDLYRLLEEQGYARAYYLHALLEAQDGSAGGQQRSRSLLETAAEKGDAFAQNALGVNYERMGERATARIWYRQAAEKGSRAAKNNLSRLQKLGAATSSSDEGIQLVRDQAKAGDKVAQFELAQRLHRGVGVPVQFQQALRYYRLSAAQGYAPARRMLQLILSKPAADGQIDADWMRQLSSMDVGGTRSEADAAGLVPAKLDEYPLADLLSLKPVVQ